MARLIALFLLFLLFALPAPAEAHDSSWSPGPMKSDGASPGIACKAVGSFQGHTRTWTYDMVGDNGQPAESERAWLESFCDYAGRADVKGWFKYQEGLDIPDDAIKITVPNSR